MRMRMLEATMQLWRTLLWCGGLPLCWRRLRRSCLLQRPW